MGSALPPIDDGVRRRGFCWGGRPRNCASDFFLGSILGGGGLSGFDRIEGEDAADGDNVQRQNNQEGVRKLHVRLLLYLVVLFVVCSRVGGRLGPQSFGRRRPPLHSSERHFQDFLHFHDLRFD
jgi:hypothetical protein